MARKDTAATVLGMLSTTGASTKPPAGLAEPSAARAEQPAEPSADVEAAAGKPEPAVSTSATRPAAPRRRTAPPPEPNVPAVPRTLRLRASTAAALRDAWLDAKRNDVLLSHQDFASDLLDAALRQRAATR
ncbi:MAG: hypothetical protein AB7V42_16745 [Thermoleophilia bacterium]